MTIKSCKTCAYAEWVTSNNGRRNFKLGGFCSYSFGNIPECVQVHRVKIYSTSGKHCPCHCKDKVPLIQKNSYSRENYATS